MKRRRSAARSVVAVIIMMIFGIAMVFFPMKTRAVGKDAPAKKGLLGGKGSVSASGSTSASGDTPSPPFSEPAPSASAGTRRCALGPASPRAAARIKALRV